jgi:hypothetical protein
MVRLHGLWVAGEPITVQPESACITSYRCASAFHLPSSWSRQSRTVGLTGLRQILCMNGVRTR